MFGPAYRPGAPPSIALGAPPRPEDTNNVLYSILKLRKADNPTKDVIKKQYRDLTRIYHPDKYVGDAAYGVRIFRAIDFAYDTLIDDEKKREYDNYGIYTPGKITNKNAFAAAYEVEHPENAQLGGKRKKSTKTRKRSKFSRRR
jgi:curved DNA-binding protein CbpA